MLISFTQTESCGYVNFAYINTHLQIVYKPSLQTASGTRYFAEKPHLHSHTLTDVHESARTFILSSLAFPITGLKIHGVFEDTAQTPLT